MEHKKDERFALEKGERPAPVAAHDVKMLPSSQKASDPAVPASRQNSPVLGQRRLKVRTPTVKPPLNAEGRDFCVKYDRHSAWKVGKEERKVRQRRADQKLKPEARRSRTRQFGKGYSSDCEGDGPKPSHGANDPVCPDCCPYQVRKNHCGKKSHFHKKDALQGKQRREQESAVRQGDAKKGIASGFFQCKNVEECNALQVLRPHHHTVKEVTTMRTKIRGREKKEAQAKSEQQVKAALLSKLVSFRAKNATSAGHEAKDDDPREEVNDNQPTASVAVPDSQGPAAAVVVTPRMPAVDVSEVQPTASVAVPVSQGPAAIELATTATPVGATDEYSDSSESDSDDSLGSLGSVDDDLLVLGGAAALPFVDNDPALDAGPQREETMYCYLPEDAVQGVVERVGELFHTVRAAVAVAVTAIPALLIPGAVGEQSLAVYRDGLLRFYPEFMIDVHRAGLVQTHAATTSLVNRGSFGMLSAFQVRSAKAKPVVTTMYNRSWSGPVWVDLFDLLVRSPIATRSILKTTVIKGVMKLCNPESVVQAMLAALQSATRRDLWLAEPQTVINTLIHVSNQLTLISARYASGRGALVDPDSGAPPTLGPPSSTF